MNFEKINKINVSLPKVKVKKEKAKGNNNKENNLLKEKTPSNPNYWQGTFGVKNVSFKANIDKTINNDDVLKLKNAGVHDCLIEFFLSSDVKLDDILKLKEMDIDDLYIFKIIEQFQEEQSSPEQIEEKIQSVLADPVAESRQINMYSVELQNAAGKQFVTDTSWEFGSTKINLKKIENLDGTISIERTEEYIDGTSRSWYVGGNTLSEGNNFFNENTLYSQTEIIYDEKTKEPVAVLSTKQADKLEGVYEKTLYQLSDYDESYDVLQGIKEGTIQGGKPLSWVDKNGAYHENITSNGCNIQRNYLKGTNGIDYDYSYKITDETGKLILDNHISLTKNSENQTTTEINGKTFVSTFDDETKIVTIESEDGIEEINFKDSIVNVDKNWNFIKKLPANLIENLKNTYLNFIPYQGDIPCAWAEKRLSCEKVYENSVKYNMGEKTYLQLYYPEKNKFYMVNKNDSNLLEMEYNPKKNSLIFLGEEYELGNATIDDYKERPIFALLIYLKGEKLSNKDIGRFLSENIDGDTVYIKTWENQNVLAHEIGHTIDKEKLNNLSTDKELIEIYNSEIDKFNMKYTNESGKKYIEYFSQIGGGNQETGLGEIIAETNTLLSNYGHDIEYIETRAQFLAQNFPKTIAYIATKIGMNAVCS